MKALCNEFKLQYVEIKTFDELLKISDQKLFKLQYVEIKTVKNVKLHIFSSITISFFIIFFNF